MTQTSALRRIGAALVLAAVLAVVSACSPRPADTETHDPFETVNRAWFDRNLALASALQRPSDTADALHSADAPTMTPAPTGGDVLQRRVRRFGSNLSHPRYVVNDLLQLRPDRAAENAWRFVINSTIGLGGLFDPAAAMGLQGRPTDFGETLHRWGANEGAYVVLPFFGPSTERDAAGMVVDLMLDPLRHVLPGREHAAASAARLAGRLADQAAFSDVIDANVMRSEDPYVQARLLFLQARRHHLGMESEDDFIDPYADFPD
ncbi:MAG: MlaA family lipoprotein [Pararhodobacter sp.]